MYSYDVCLLLPTEQKVLSAYLNPWQSSQAWSDSPSALPKKLTPSGIQTQACPAPPNMAVGMALSNHQASQTTTTYIILLSFQNNH